MLRDGRLVISSPAEPASSPVDPSAQLFATEAEQQQRLANLYEEPVEGDLEPALHPVANPQPPGTPTRNASESATNEQTPKTPQFVDARSSPASSDKLSAIGDVFEDAVSSPRLNIPKARPRPISSPLSDADDSSMLRLVAEYDEGPGRVGRHSSLVEEKENKGRRASASSQQVKSPAKESPRKQSLRKRSVAPPADKAPDSSSEVQKPSSDPSLIPETPAPRPQDPSKGIIVIDGVEYDPDDTIEVDYSSLENKDDLPKATGQGPRKKLTTYSNKRKLLPEVSGEVPDSQDVKPAPDKRRKRRLADDTSEVANHQESKATMESMQPPLHLFDYMLITALESSPKKKSPSRKKRVGRPKRASQVSQQETDGEVEQSQSPSVDLDASMPEPEFEDSTTDMATSAKEATMDEEVEDTELHEDDEEVLPPTEYISTPDDDINMAGAEELVTEDRPTDDAHDTLIGNSVEATSSDIEKVEETIINRSTFNDESSPVAETPESNNDPSAEIVPATTSDVIESPPALSLEEQTSANAREEIEPRVSIQSMKDKLQSLIDDMATAVVTRDEGHELEDMIYSLNTTLRGAQRRGREWSEMNM